LKLKVNLKALLDLLASIWTWGRQSGRWDESQGPQLGKPSKLNRPGGFGK
jgi:hypothetical protein